MGDPMRDILGLLYAGEKQVTGTFVYFKLGIEVDAAEQLLDKMRQQGMLELDSDPDGNMFYVLPATDRVRSKQAISAGPAPPPPVPSAVATQPVVQVVQQYRHAPVAPAPTHSPGVAVLLSALFVGGGQIYNNEVLKGLFVMALCFFLWFVFLGWIIWILAVIDASQIAHKIRNQQQIAYDAYTRGY